ncbi:MAG: gamma-glutamyl-gamma-aminobutyrate hydrolase family protein [Phycisphaerales bacterium JB060]
MDQRGQHDRPLIGIAGDVDVAPSSLRTDPPALRSCCRMSYIDAITAAGGLPIVLPPIAEQIPDQLALVDGVLLIGGDDPRTEPFGEPTDPRVTPVVELRQVYDSALLRALKARAEMPVLGVCYGMQMMALLAGGRLDQHLPESLGDAWEAHWHRPHVIEPGKGAPAWLVSQSDNPYSRHRQAVDHAGSLAVGGVAPDGVIEVVHDPGRPFYVGVQWHPERSGNGALGLGVYSVFVQACRGQDGP